MIQTLPALPERTLELNNETFAKPLYWQEDCSTSMVVQGRRIAQIGKGTNLDVFPQSTINLLQIFTLW